MRRKVVGGILGMTLCGASALAQDLRVLQSSNGHGAVTLDLQTRKLDAFWPEIYRAESPGVFVPDLLFDAYVGLVVGGRVTWLRDVPFESATFEPGTGIVTTEQRVEGRTVRQWLFAPWDAGRAAVALYAEVDGAGAGDALVTVENLHLGGPSPGGDVAGETMNVQGNGHVVESGVRGVVHHLPLGRPTGLAVSPVNPFVLASEGRAFPPVEDAQGGRGDDLVVGYRFEAENGALTGGFLWLHGPEAPAAGLQVGLEAERALWARWQAGLTLPEETALTRQQAAFLRMAQVRSPGGGYGQILASLPPGIWNIAWVRDMAFATAAFARIGALEEAWEAIAFQLGADVGYYEEYVGRPYLISVTRYFGNGREESDANQNGPNVEWDDFGLFLWSVGEWVRAGGDLERLRPEWGRIERGVLEVLEALTDDLDLLVPDSSIWERHWEGGNLEDGLRQRFTFSSVMAAVGACRGAEVAASLGLPSDRWRALAHRLREGIASRLVGPSGVLGASLEQVQRGFGDLDLAVVEAFTQGVLPYDGEVARATWAAVDRSGLDGGPGLRVGRERGFKRNDDGIGRGQAGWYDEQEWIFIDLRTEIWRRAAGLEGADLTEMLRRRANAAAYVLPELLGQLDGRFEGALPMVGFGSGAWLLGLNAVPEPFCAPPSGGPPADAGPGEMDAGPVADAQPGVADAAELADAEPRTDVASDARTSRPDMTSEGLPPPQDAGRIDVVEPDAGPASGSSGGGGGCALVHRPVSGLRRMALLSMLALAAVTVWRRRDGGR